MTASLVNARRRAQERRAEAAAARERTAARARSASDDLTTLTVDPAGNIVSVEFAAEVVDSTTARWAQSLQAMHRRARQAVRVPFGAAPPLAPPTVRPSGPVTAGKPLADAQAATRRATDELVARFATLPTETEVTGSAREVWLTINAAKDLVTARATPAALQRGPSSLAAAVTDAWADARRQLLAPIGAGSES